MAIGSVVWAASGVFAIAGLALLYFGLFHDRPDGRRRCPRCAYDLSGTPSTMTCSECGFTTSNASDFYRIRRSWRLTTAGIVLLLIGLAPVCLHFGRQVPWLEIAPVMVLERVATNDTAIGINARSELLRRVEEELISDRRTRALVARVLDWQSDPDFPWHETDIIRRARLGDIIEAADHRGLLTDEQFERYVKQAFKQPITITARDRVRAGKPFSYRLSQPQPRLSSRFVRGQPEQPVLMAKGQIIDVEGCGVPPDQNMAIMTLANTWSQSFTTASLPCALPPGEHDITLHIDVGLRSVDYENPWWGPDDYIRSIDDFRDLRHRWTTEVSFSVTAVNDDEELVELVDDSDLVDVVRDAIEVRFGVESVTIGGIPQPVSPSAQGVVIIEPLPVTLAYKVIGRANGREIALGGFTFGTGQVAGARMVQLHGDGLSRHFPDHDAIDVILRPNITLAEQSFEIDRIWNREIVLEDVPLQYEAPQREK